ncbi:hypothetical protein ASF53_05240 [Methylobacterium sp. Leaf123]|uniref:hypothetical protein n=1 Tax=Methylobacterium sp. Leaf123 TaxID=1736264 RepID=UPI0006FC579C|nr:hypothetical protein [Methylobacterium sp. Leaf123]KQQ23729.1 hypothetical protein ASF53_05240 [Methylobacterium sp. Leaf123]
MPKPKPAATATLEAELSGLFTTRDNLRARQTALAVELEEAVARRREVLIEGSDTAATADAERACRDVEGTAAGIADALAEVERRISATEDKIEDARIAGEREAAAAALERDGKAIDAAAERVRQAVTALAAAQAALAGAITVTASPHFAKTEYPGRRDQEAPETLAAYLTGHMIATTLPGLEVSEAGRRERFGWLSAKPIEATHGETPAKPLLTDPMRELAARVRAGEASTDLPRFKRPEPDFAPSVPLEEIFVLTAFRYTRKEGYLPEIVNSVVSTIPAPVAQQAITAGFASKVEPHNIASLRERRRAQSNNLNINDLPDLGFDLGAWVEGETARRRAAWLAEQDRQAA